MQEFGQGGRRETGQPRRRAEVKACVTERMLMGYRKYRAGDPERGGDDREARWLGRG